MQDAYIARLAELIASAEARGGAFEDIEREEGKLLLQLVVCLEKRKWLRFSVWMDEQREHERQLLRDSLLRALWLVAAATASRRHNNKDTEKAKEKEADEEEEEEVVIVVIKKKQPNERKEGHPYSLDAALDEAIGETGQALCRLVIQVLFWDFENEMGWRDPKLLNLILSGHPHRLHADCSPHTLLLMQAIADKLFSMLVQTSLEGSPSLLLSDERLRHAVIARVRDLLQASTSTDAKEQRRASSETLPKWAAPEIRQFRGLEIGVTLSGCQANEQTVTGILGLCAQYMLQFVAQKQQPAERMEFVIQTWFQKLYRVKLLGKYIEPLINCILLLSTHRSLSKLTRCTALQILLRWVDSCPSTIRKTFRNSNNDNSDNLHSSSVLLPFESFAAPHDPDLIIDAGVETLAHEAYAQYTQHSHVVLEKIMLSLLKLLADLPDDPAWAARCFDDEDLSDYYAGTRFAQILVAIAPHTSKLILGLLPTLLTSQRWQTRNAAWLLMQGASSIINGPTFQNILFQMQESINDEEPRVRWAICDALDQLCPRLSTDNMSSEWHVKVASLFQTFIIHDPCDKVRGRACSAVSSFASSPQFHLFKESFVNLLINTVNEELSKAASSYVTRMAVRSLSHLVFEPRSQTIVPFFLKVAEHAQKINDHRLLAIIVEKLSFAATLQPDNDHATIIPLLHCIDDRCSEPVLQAKHLALVRMCTLMGNDFAPFVATTVRQLHALLKDTCLSVSCQSTICKSLCVIASLQRERFYPYLQRSVELLAQLITNVPDTALRREVFMALPVYFTVENKPEKTVMMVKRFIQVGTKVINDTSDYQLMSTVAVVLQQIIVKQHIDDSLSRPCFELCQAILSYIHRELNNIKKMTGTTEKDKQILLHMTALFVEFCRHVAHSCVGFYPFFDDLQSSHPQLLELMLSQVDERSLQAYWILYDRPFFTSNSNNNKRPARPTVPSLRALAGRAFLRLTQQAAKASSAAASSTCSPSSQLSQLPEEIQEYLRRHHTCGLCRKPYLEAVMVGRGATCPMPMKWESGTCRPFWSLCSFECFSEATSYSTMSHTVSLRQKETEVLLMMELQ
ncbi:hypothetical protein QOT17_023779 [Balamuthia mandrillaris]